MRQTAMSSFEDISQTELFQQIGDICATVNIVVNEKELLELSLKKIMQLFGAKRGSIFILKENGKDLILKTAKGMKSDETEKMVKRLGEGIVGRVAKSKEPIFVDDISKDNRFLNFKGRSSYKTPSFICAPLMIKDELIGVINITDKDTGHRFNETDMLLLDFLTTQIALNYHRIKLYHKFKKIIKESKTLKDELGRTDDEKKHLKKQIVIHEKLATIGKLAGGIAHEFNNPLDGVIRYTNLCLEHVKDDDVVRGYLLEVKHGLNRMANIVKNLLACSRNDYPERQFIEFDHALEQALSSKKSDIQAKHIAFTKKIDKNIPLIKDLGLERILTNLINNAVDSIEQDGKITLKAKSHNSVLEFTISDTGRGIPVDHVDKVFEPFFTTKEIDKGCGLGLTIVGEIVKCYGGKINLESKEGKGTSFSIKLPLDEDDG